MPTCLRPVSLRKSVERVMGLVFLQHVSCSQLSSCLVLSPLVCTGPSSLGYTWCNASRTAAKYVVAKQCYRMNTCACVVGRRNYRSRNYCASGCQPNKTEAATQWNCAEWRRSVKKSPLQRGGGGQSLIYFLHYIYMSASYTCVEPVSSVGIVSSLQLDARQIVDQFASGAHLACY
jgi:hypothetical protein